MKEQQSHLQLSVVPLLASHFTLSVQYWQPFLDFEASFQSLVNICSWPKMPFNTWLPTGRRFVWDQFTHWLICAIYRASPFPISFYYYIVRYLTMAGTPPITPFSVSIKGSSPEGFNYLISLEQIYCSSSSIHSIFFIPTRMQVICT